LTNNKPGRDRIALLKPVNQKEKKEQTGMIGHIESATQAMPLFIRLKSGHLH